MLRELGEWMEEGIGADEDKSVLGYDSPGLLHFGNRIGVGGIEPTGAALKESQSRRGTVSAASTEVDHVFPFD